MAGLADTQKDDDRQDKNQSVAMRVQNLQKQYGMGPDAVNAVDDVSFEVDSGSIVGLLGPNGAGKTTTIKCILGMIIPDNGCVELLDKEVNQNPRKIYNDVGAMFEGARNIYWRLSVRQNLEFFTRLTGTFAGPRRQRHDELLERFDLESKADVPVKDLSRGMKQKVSLIATLSRDVQLVFLDEPTLGLDLETSLALRTELERMVEEENLTVVLSTHDMSVVEDICDRVVVMQDGNVVANETVPELLGVFDDNTYRVRVEADQQTELRQRVDEEFGIGECDTFEDTFEFTVTVSPSEFHHLSTVIEESEEELRSVDSVETDLGDAFLDVLEEEQ